MEETLAYVAGFCCANDVGLHDFRHADRGSMLRVKGQDGFLPSVPSWCRPPSGTLRLHCARVNGEIVQATADDVIWPVQYQLADLCRLITLEPGRGADGHSGELRPMDVGDVVEVEVTGLGRLLSTVVEWEVDLAGPESSRRSPRTRSTSRWPSPRKRPSVVAEGRFP